MPRPMLKTHQQTKTGSILEANITQRQNKQTTQMTKMTQDRLLRKTRSKKYMEMMSKLDSGGHVHNKQQVDEIINTIKEEFPEVELAGIMLGCISKCYLGSPYEVHTLDFAKGILYHYQAGEPMPGDFDKVRGLAIHGGYEFIEIYSDCCRAVSGNGTVSVIHY